MGLERYMPTMHTLTGPDGSIGSFELQTPVYSGGGEVKSIHFRKPNLGDIQGIEKAATHHGQIAADIITIARLAGITADAAEHIDTDDFSSIQKALEGFFSQSQKELITEAKATGFAVALARSQ